MNLEIVIDNDPINPREEDNLGTILYCSSRYLLGDKSVSRNEITHCMNDNENIVLPVYAYIHSGIVLHTSGFSCQWDSGQSGCIFVKKDVVRNIYNVKRISPKMLNKVNNILRSEIETFSNYISGEVYAYVIKNENGDIVESCGNFYSEKEAKEEGLLVLKHLMKA